MPKCPKCGAEIHYTLELDAQGDIERVYQGDIDNEETSFECSICGEELFIYQEDAEAFLKGELDERKKMDREKERI